MTRVQRRRRRSDGAMQMASGSSRPFPLGVRHGLLNNGNGLMVQWLGFQFNALQARFRFYSRLVTSRQRRYAIVQHLKYAEIGAEGNLEIIVDQNMVLLAIVLDMSSSSLELESKLKYC